MAQGSLFHTVGAATAKLRNPEHLFSLDEEIDSIKSWITDLDCPFTIRFVKSFVSFFALNPTLWGKILCLQSNRLD